MTQRFLLFNFLCLTMLIQSCKKDQQPIGTPGDLHIDSFAPETAAKDSVLIITGTNFSPDPTKNIVKFNGVTARIIAATATTLTVRVPAGAVAGKISVETSGKVASSANDFAYIYTVTTLAGDGIAGFKEGESSVAEFKLPYGIAVDASGNVYVGDGGNNRIRKVTTTGVVSTLAGNGNSGFVEGAADVAEFHNPEGVAVDASGNVFVADFANYRVRKISAGMVTTVAGNGIAGFKDGDALTAQFFDPKALPLTSREIYL